MAPTRLADVRVHWLPVDRLLDRAYDVWPWLSIVERRRTVSFHSEGERKRYVIAHAFMRGVLSAYLGSDPREIEIHHTPVGRPVIAKPWPAIGFSLSRCETHAAVAVAPVTQVGVDIECCGRAIDCIGVARAFFNNMEIEFLAALPPSECEVQFLRLWTCKEAFAKAIGLGLRYPLDRFAIRGVQSLKPELEMLDREAHTGDEWSLDMRELKTGCYAAVAAPRTAGHQIQWNESAKHVPVTFRDARCARLR